MQNQREVVTIRKVLLKKSLKILSDLLFIDFKFFVF